MTAILIGITVSHIHKKDGSQVNSLSLAYTDAVVRAGGTPILIPNDFPLGQLDELRSTLAGIILSGGGDIQTSKFSGKPHPKVANVSPERDAVEFALVAMAVKTDWPMLGICRGHQVINAALGGKLYTHIPDQFPTSIQHDTPDHMGRDFLAHEVEIESGSNLHKITGLGSIQVNSFHHQAVESVAPELKVTARASDGLIEGVELVGHRFCMGVQWHPECIQTRLEQRQIVSSFLAASKP